MPDNCVSVVNFSCPEGTDVEVLVSLQRGLVRSPPAKEALIHVCGVYNDV